MSDSLPVLIIPVLNRYDLLDSLLDSVNYPIDNIFIVDNGGNYERKQDNLKILNMPINIGVSASWNLGIKCFPFAEYWTFTAIDVILRENTLKNTSMYSRKDLMMISNYGFNYFSIGHEFIEEVGLFDENYFPGYHEDVDFEKRARMLGVGNKIVYPDINVDLFDTTITVKSNKKYPLKKQKTDIIHEKYMEKKFASSNWHMYNWSIKLRRECDWDNDE